MRYSCDLTWKKLGIQMEHEDYWVNHNLIPLGSLEPQEEYPHGRIPDEDIVTISFDPINIPFTQRSANNVLCLAASGDGKSMLKKIDWYVRQKAGFFCIYIDRKSLDAARAKKPWASKRIPPYMKPSGIPLKHYMPAFNTIDDYEHMIHNFKLYDWNLPDISERDMLRGLGMSLIAASHFTEMIQKDTTADDLFMYIEECLRNKEGILTKGSLENAQRTLLNLKYFDMINNNHSRLDMLKELQEQEKVNSLVISYNNTDDRNLLTFDIGLKIKQASRLSTRYGCQVPIFFYLDDGSDYAQEVKGVEFNFAVEQIKKIGFDYRSKGVYNWLSVQSLGIIDEDVAEGYPIKIISPYFRNPDSLSKINIPRKAIKYLKDGKLRMDKEKHIVQWILINEDNKVIPFYPFTPPCNHFTEVYKPKFKKAAV